MIEDKLTEFFSLYNQGITPATAVASLGLSFLLSMLVAIVYQWTFRGFTYSRNFIHAIVLGALVTCTLIMAVGSNVARGLGILGTLTIIRFRTPVRDPRDAIFLFSALGAGIACGAGGYVIAVVGTVFFAGAAALLHVLPFASRREYEAMLRFSVKSGDDPETDAALKDVLVRYCASYTLLGICDCQQGDRVECAYQIRLVDPAYQQDLVTELKKAGLFESPTLIFQRNTVEL